MALSFYFSLSSLSISLRPSTGSKICLAAHGLLFISFTRVDGEIWREKTEDYQPWKRELILNLSVGVLVVMVGCLLSFAYLGSSRSLNDYADIVLAKRKIEPKRA